MIKVTITWRKKAERKVLMETVTSVARMVTGPVNAKSNYRARQLETKTIKRSNVPVVDGQLTIRRTGFDVKTNAILDKQKVKLEDKIIILTTTKKCYKKKCTFTEKKCTFS